MIHIDIPLNRCACWLHHHVLQATFTYIPMQYNPNGKTNYLFPASITRVYQFIP